MFRDTERKAVEEAISIIFNSTGYESGFDFNKLPRSLNLSSVDGTLPDEMSILIKKISSEDNREVGYMAKIGGEGLIKSSVEFGTRDGQHIILDSDEFLKIYGKSGIRRREKLLYDLHTHEAVDIGPSPNDLTNLLKDIKIFGGHFSIIVTKSRIYLLVRTQSTPSLPILKAIDYVKSIQNNYEDRFRNVVSNEPNFVATKQNQNKLLAKVNSEWLPQICSDNKIGLYEMSVADFQESGRLILKLANL